MPSSQKKRSCAARSHSREPVLITESGRKYAAFRKQLNSELQPGGVMMRALVGDLAALAWDDERLIRWKADILNGAFCEALQNVLRRVWSDDFESHAERERTIEDLAWQWLRNDASAKARVRGAARAAPAESHCDRNRGAPPAGSRGRPTQSPVVDERGTPGKVRQIVRHPGRGSPRRCATGQVRERASI